MSDELGRVALTDAEWRAFQAIPEQGYSHRAWVNFKIYERLAIAAITPTPAVDVSSAVLLWAERFLPGDRWDAEDMRDLHAALGGTVEANPDRIRARAERLVPLTRGTIKCAEGNHDTCFAHEACQCGCHMSTTPEREAGR